MLVEFPSIVEAVMCAAEVQWGMIRRNAGIGEHERVSFRIGVNIGDIIVEPDDIFGDGINIAARLEALAEPDGICISDVVYQQIRGKLDFPFEDAGHHQVKSIDQPLHVFALRPRVIAGLASAGADLSAALTAPNSSSHTAAPRVCRLLCCRSPISATTANSNIWRTRSPTI